VGLFGGVGVVTVAAAAFVSKLVADRSIESHKAELGRETEKLKGELAKETETHKLGLKKREKTRERASSLPMALARRKPEQARYPTVWCAHFDRTHWLDLEGSQLHPGSISRTCTSHHRQRGV
jgi:hypothetical protein